MISFFASSIFALDINSSFLDRRQDPATIRVFLGASGQNLFRPSFVDANLGDVVRFEFLSNIAVVQSSFDNPLLWFVLGSNSQAV